MRLVFGGTFDPVHVGHLRMATEVSEAMAAGPVWLMPCYQAVHKDAVAGDADARTQMLELAVAHDPLLKVDDREVLRASPSYTIDTLRELKALKPDESIALIMGTDSFASFSSWKENEAFSELCHLIVVERPGAQAQFEIGQQFHGFESTLDRDRLSKKGSGYALFLELNLLSISSSDIRERLAQGNSARYIVPSAVLKFICDNALYLPRGG